MAKLEGSEPIGTHHPRRVGSARAGPTMPPTGAAHKLAVHQDVDEPPEWVTNIEATNVPRFIGGAVFDRDMGILRALKSGVEIIHLNRQIGDRRPRPALG